MNNLHVQLVVITIFAVLLALALFGVYALTIVGYIALGVGYLVVSNVVGTLWALRS